MMVVKIRCNAKIPLVFSSLLLVVGGGRLQVLRRGINKIIADTAVKEMPTTDDALMERLLQLTQTRNQYWRDFEHVHGLADTAKTAATIEAAAAKKADVAAAAEKAGPTKASTDNSVPPRTQPTEEIAIANESATAERSEEVKPVKAKEVAATEDKVAAEKADAEMLAGKVGNGLEQGAATGSSIDILGNAFTECDRWQTRNHFLVKRQMASSLIECRNACLAELARQEWPSCTAFMWDRLKWGKECGLYDCIARTGKNCAASGPSMDNVSLKRRREEIGISVIKQMFVLQSWWMELHASLKGSPLKHFSGRCNKPFVTSVAWREIDSQVECLARCLETPRSCTAYVWEPGRRKKCGLYDCQANGTECAFTSGAGEWALLGSYGSSTCFALGQEWLDWTAQQSKTDYMKSLDYLWFWVALANSPLKQARAK